MQPVEIVAQVIGIIAVVVSFITYQLKSKKSICIVLSIAIALFCVHYALLGETIGVVLNVVCIIRNVCYTFENNRILSHKAVPIVLTAIMGILSILTWEGFHTALFASGIMINTLSLGYLKPQNLRKSLLLSCSLILIYNAVVSSWGGLINEAFVIISAIIALIRYRNTDAA